MDTHPMCGSKPVWFSRPAKHSGQKSIAFMDISQQIQESAGVVYSVCFGRRITFVLCVFILPQSKALTQILALIWFVVQLRWRKALMSELSSLCLAEACSFMGSIIWMSH